MLPPAKVLEAFNPIFAPLVEFTVAASCPITNDSWLRDTLFPKLISGELRVTDVKSRVEALV